MLRMLHTLLVDAVDACGNFLSTTSLGANWMRNSVISFWTTFLSGRSAIFSFSSHPCMVAWGCLENEAVNTMRIFSKAPTQLQHEIKSRPFFRWSKTRKVFHLQTNCIESLLIGVAAQHVDILVLHSKIFHYLHGIMAYETWYRRLVHPLLFPSFPFILLSQWKLLYVILLRVRENPDQLRPRCCALHFRCSWFFVFDWSSICCCLWNKAE